VKSESAGAGLEAARTELNVACVGLESTGAGLNVAGGVIAAFWVKYHGGGMTTGGPPTT
jgi:hypothetical protein